MTTIVVFKATFSRGLQISATAKFDADSGVVTLPPSIEKMIEANWNTPITEAIIERDGRRYMVIPTETRWIVEEDLGPIDDNLLQFDVIVHCTHGNAESFQLHAASGFAARTLASTHPDFVWIIQCAPTVTPTTPKFKVGDNVKGMNDYGVVWTRRKIARVDLVDGKEPEYLLEPTDSPWISTPESMLELDLEVSE